MNMPTPPHPQGPYGPPQQQPNPYGGPQHPQYPQQPYPPQPYPQQQQPYPGPGMWGQPPMGPPPRKNRTAMTLSIVFGSIIFLLVLSWFGNRNSDAASSSGSSSGPFPAASHRLTLPPTLLDGEYKLTKDDSKDADAEADAAGYGDGPGARNVKAAIGTYNGGEADAPHVLVITGMSGQFKDPEQSRASLLKGMRETEGMSEPNAPQMITPPGSDLTLECTVLVSEDQGESLTIPLCAWADENTVGSVMLSTPESAAQDPGSVDLDATAKTTVKVRDETRQPIVP